VLGLYLDGYSYEQVGERLTCDTKTVDNALQRVKRKVGAHLDSRAVAA
jgi:RNA polymerase sporulation-specific sigma factor